MKAELNKDPDLKALFHRGEHLIWITGAALSLSLLMITGLILLVISRGMGFFWPSPLTQVTGADGKDIAGVVMSSEKFRKQGADGKMVSGERSNIKVGNRDLYGLDFRWVEHEGLTNWRTPKDAIQIERWEYGDFIGFIKSFNQSDAPVAEGTVAWERFKKELPIALKLHRKIAEMERDEIGAINNDIRAAELKIKKIQFAEKDAVKRDSQVAQLQAQIAKDKVEFEEVRVKVAKLAESARTNSITMLSSDGREKTILMDQIVRAYQPNSMSFLQKAGHYIEKLTEFITDEPREANTEGGIWPAIFGTVMMTLILSALVAPLGVVAAFYLREYAKQGPIVRAVRIAINNLAGVPSIVFGVFGLGFFIYTIGGTLDSIFYPERLPTPTFGTGGILWASFTLALLTVPVVIVATEESIAAVPRGMREGSLALGASKFQTVCRIIFPAAVPGMLTGLILAMARGAGEVAPLMITGVVKLAPALPVDATAPFVHLERKFMHLGFHIYDVGFQSPNIEAAKPMVYTTTLLLLIVVVLLNVAAIQLRDKIRKKYQTGAFA